MLVVLFPLSFCDAAPFLNLASIRGGGEYPYTLGVRDSFMIGHSFRGNPDFGPAANMVRIIDWPLFYYFKIVSIDIKCLAWGNLHM